MVRINITERNLDKIIESLERNSSSSNEQLLINYLKEVKRDLRKYSSPELDEIPF